MGTGAEQDEITRRRDQQRTARSPPKEAVQGAARGGYRAASHPLSRYSRDGHVFLGAQASHFLVTLRDKSRGEHLRKAGNCRVSSLSSGCGSSSTVPAEGNESKGSHATHPVTPPHRDDSRRYLRPSHSGNLVSGCPFGDCPVSSGSNSHCRRNRAPTARFPLVYRGSRARGQDLDVQSDSGRTRDPLCRPG